MRKSPQSPKHVSGRPHRILEQLESRLLMSAVPAAMGTNLDDLESLIQAELGGAFPAAEVAEGSSFGGMSAHRVQLGCSWESGGGAPLAMVVNAGVTAQGEQGAWLQLSRAVLGHWQDCPETFQWTKLSGPGNVEFNNPQVANALARFDTPGDYELQLVGTSGGLTVLGQLAVGVTAADVNVINIDQAWLAAQGQGPYYLDQAGKTYRLQTDVTTEGTAFVVLNRDVTFDLNGHKIVYGNSAPITVPHGGFEEGTTPTDIPGWTFSDPTVASRVAARTGMFGDWMLRLNAITATQTVTSQAISIPLANVEYAATVSAKGPSGSTVNIAVVDTVTGTVLGNANSANIDRGFAATVKFKPTTTNDVIIRITVTPSAGAPRTVELDYVALERSRDYGVVASPSSWNFPDHLKTSTVTANASKVRDFTLTNGTIEQGIGRSVNGSPVYAQSLNGFTMEGMRLVARGMDTNHLFGQYLNNPVIRNNVFIGQLDRISNRMLQFAAISLSQASGTVLVQGNDLSGSMHTGIVVTRNGNDTNPATVLGNSIRHEALGTDGYGIVINNLKNFAIRENTIQPTNGRGILLDGYTSGFTSDGVIEGNLVEARETANLEYAGTGMEATALRVRNYDTSGFKNLTFRNNVFFGETGIGADWAAIGARLTLNNTNGQLNDANILFEGNTFRARLNSLDPNYSGARSPRAWGLSLSTVAAGTGTRFLNNRFESNDISLNIGDNDGWNGMIDGVTFQGSVFAPLGSGVTMTHRSIVAGDWSATVQNVRLFDNRYEGGATSQVHFLGSKIKDLSIGWLLNLVVSNPGGTAVAGATVGITDREGRSLFSGTTDEEGRIQAIPLISTVLRQTTNDPTQITTESRGPFALQVISGTLTASQSFELTANLDLAITVE